MLCGNGRVRTQDLGYQAEGYDHCAARLVTTIIYIIAIRPTLRLRFRICDNAAAYAAARDSPYTVSEACLACAASLLPRGGPWAAVTVVICSCLCGRYFAVATRLELLFLAWKRRNRLATAAWALALYLNWNPLHLGYTGMYLYMSIYTPLYYAKYSG